MNFKKIFLTPVASALLLSTLSANNCVDIQSTTVSWTSYKTMAKIGVSGTFKDLMLIPSNKHSDIKSALVGTAVQIDMADIDAKANIKTSNILKYFVPQLSSQRAHAKIVKVNEKTLDVAVTLNGVKQIIPMTYSLDGGVCQAKGTIDARDFLMEGALKNLNTHVAGHKNKGWLDIDIAFELIYVDNCLKK